MGYYPKFRDLLDKCLSALDMSGSQVARRLKISPSTVTRWRNGQSRPSTPEMAVRLADVLNLHGAKRDELLRMIGYAPATTSHRNVSETAEDMPRLVQSSASLLLPNPPFQHLVNREKSLKMALDALQNRNGSWIIGIDGVGGIGKTALAHGILQACQKHLIFDAYVWVNATHRATAKMGEVARQTSPTGGLTYEGILNGIVQQLGVPELSSLDEQEKEQRVFTLLRQQRVVVVLNNIEMSQDDQEILIARLFPLLNPSKVICTSRHRFYGDVLPIHLEGLDTDATALLIEQEAQARQVTQLQQIPAEHVVEFASVSGGSPLTAKLAVGQASHLPFETITEQVRTARIASGVGRRGETLYRQIYLPSWWLLSTEAQKLLVALALLIPGEGGPLAMAVEVSGLSQVETLDAVADLWRLSLIETTTRSRQVLQAEENSEETELYYYTHPLTAHFVIHDICGWQREGVSALSQTDSEENETAFDAALFLQTCVEQGIVYIEKQLMVYGERPPPELIRQLAMRMLDYGLEIAEIWAGTSRLLLKIAPRMERAGHRNEWLPYLENGITLSQRLDDQATLAELWLQLGVLYRSLNRVELADEMFSASVNAYNSLADDRNHARALNRLANVKRLQKQYVLAQTLVMDALSLSAEGDPVQASSYYVLGTIAFDEQQWHDAKKHFVSALDLFEHNGDKHMSAHALCDLGAVHYVLEELDEASMYYQRAIEHFIELGDTNNEARHCMNLGVTHLQMSEYRKALELFSIAQPVFEKFQDVTYLAMIHNNQGITCRHIQQWAEGEQAFRYSIELWEQLDNTWEKSNVFNELGLLYLEKTSVHQAKTIFEESLQLVNEESHHPDYQKRVTKIQAYLAIAHKKLEV